MVTIVFLPQRFQLPNGLTPAEAGTQMLALLLFSALGAGLGGAISSRRNIAWYILVTALALQLLGLGLLSTLPASGPVTVRQYGYQAILGLGFGLSLSSLVIMARVEVGPSDVGESGSSRASGLINMAYVRVRADMCVCSGDDGGDHAGASVGGRNRDCDCACDPQWPGPGRVGGGAT